MNKKTRALALYKKKEAVSWASVNNKETPPRKKKSVFHSKSATNPHLRHTIPTPKAVKQQSTFALVFPLQQYQQPQQQQKVSRVLPPTRLSSWGVCVSLAFAFSRETITVQARETNMLTPQRIFEVPPFFFPAGMRCRSTGQNKPQRTTGTWCRGTEPLDPPVQRP